MRNEKVVTDITVVGGGLSGVCAAIAAGRLGRTVALVQNRPVLGGNSSSEVRVWVCGATGHGTNRYARETGIIGELFLENQYRNPEGNPYLWDLVLLEAVRAEPNIRLFLNTDVHEVEAVGGAEDRRIQAVTGWMMGSERRIRYESPVYLDCTGDGLAGFMAGAEFRIGREAKAEYGEEWAPEAPDDITLGSTLLFYTKDAGHPVRFIAPAFAKDITQTSIPMRRIIRSGDSGCHYWWIEWGGELDTVHDNERIRDELWSVIYGIWDYIKNSGKFDADSLTLEWVGSVPGKREYRRFVGDYVLNQLDILAQEPFDDRVAFGGWSIDLHPPQGMYAEESGSRHLFADGNYHIPFRSLYSRNVDNLLFAGRNISASHVAFGTTRVMATCAVMGEAAGTGAALCAQKGVTPRELLLRDIASLQQTLLRQDASLIGVANEDPLDLARSATADASSTCQRIDIVGASEAYSLNASVGLLFPVDGPLERIELLLDADRSTRLDIELWHTGKKINYVPAEKVSAFSITVPAGENQWAEVPVLYRPDEPRNAFVIVRANPHVRLYLSDEPLFGVLGFERRQDEGEGDESLADLACSDPVAKWSMRGVHRKPFCLRVHPRTSAYSPSQILNGYARPYGGPNVWLSDRMAPGTEEWIRLTWPEPIPFAEIHLTFNDDVNEDLINLHHHRTPYEIMPELVRDYRLEIKSEKGWIPVHEEKGNRKRKRVHRLPARVTTDQLRLVVEATNGSRRASVTEIRVYDSPCS
ncbi:FAD-dependent oxidoreductase [Cohnella suwonensis]|uniref:FAD-dependent oxidoreductase n=1 Tax=Cohnella suwonensis TaxID=696072 RepID=A0ABW0LXF9_9BACL